MGRVSRFLGPKPRNRDTSGFAAGHQKFRVSHGETSETRLQVSALWCRNRRGVPSCGARRAPAPRLQDARADTWTPRVGFQRVDYTRGRAGSPCLDPCCRRSLLAPARHAARTWEGRAVAARWPRGLRIASAPVGQRAAPRDAGPYLQHLNPAARRCGAARLVLERAHAPQRALVYGACRPARRWRPHQVRERGAARRRSIFS